MLERTDMVVSCGHGRKTYSKAERAAVRGFVGWARFPFVRVDATPGGHTVHILDARYARRNSRGFGSTSVDLDAELRPRPP